MGLWVFVGEISVGNESGFQGAVGIRRVWRGIFRGIDHKELVGYEGSTGLSGNCQWEPVWVACWLLAEVRSGRCTQCSQEGSQRRRVFVAGWGDGMEISGEGEVRVRRFCWEFGESRLFFGRFRGCRTGGRGWVIFGLV